jgi:plastocyanin
VMPMPMMHEPGPTHMSRFESPTGIPVAAGDTLRLTAVYDNSIPHMRVMGIMLLFFAPGAVADGCAPVPPLQIDLGTPGPPEPSMPLTLLRRPSGPVAKHITNTTVSDFRYGAQRVLLRIGQTFRWRFVGTMAHDVTLATGPVGIASPSLKTGSFSFRFTRAGIYNFYCSLHPAQMTETIVVRKG